MIRKCILNIESIQDVQKTEMKHFALQQSEDNH